MRDWSRHEHEGGRREETEDCKRHPTSFLWREERKSKASKKPVRENGMTKACEWHNPEQQQERRVTDTWDTEKTTKGFSGKLNFCLGRSSFLFYSFAWLLILSLQSHFYFKVQCKEWHERSKTEVCQDKKRFLRRRLFSVLRSVWGTCIMKRIMKKTFDSLAPPVTSSENLCRSILLDNMWDKPVFCKDQQRKQHELQQQMQRCCVSLHIPVHIPSPPEAVSRSRWINSHVP